MKKLNDSLDEQNIVDRETEEAIEEISEMIDVDMLMQTEIILKVGNGLMKRVSLNDIDNELGSDKLRKALEDKRLTEEEVLEIIQKAAMEYTEKIYGQKVETCNISKLTSQQDIKNFVAEEYKKSLLADVDVYVGNIHCVLRVIDLERIKSCTMTIIFGAIWVASMSLLNLEDSMIMILLGNLLWGYSLYYSMMLTLSAIDRLFMDK